MIQRDLFGGFCNQSKGRRCRPEEEEEVSSLSFSSQLDSATSRRAKERANRDGADFLPASLHVNIEQNNLTRAKRASERGMKI